MDDPPQSFGRIVVGEPSRLLLLEAERRAHMRFEKVDALVASVLVSALQGQTVVTHSRGPRRNDEVTIERLDAEQRRTLDDVFSLESQNSRGAWYFPERANVSIGLVNFPAHFRRHDRFAWGTAITEDASVVLKNSSDGVFVWAMLEPLFERLFEVFALRGHRAGMIVPADGRHAWLDAEKRLDALGFNVGKELSPMRSAHSWCMLEITKQLDVKRELLNTLAGQVRPENGKRYRASCLVALIQRYYENAKNGSPKKTRVLTRPYQRTLSAFFGGDWLAFLDYIGEPPHPDEQITTALPKARPFVRAKRQVKEVAAAKGVSPEAVQEILSSYWAQSGASSPVEQRVAVLRRYWIAFDQAHARQVPGMLSLWGLVDEGGFITFDDVWRSPYTPNLYRNLLATDLISEIDGLWGTTVSERFPDRIVSESFPHRAMAQAFGPALQFWHGCALTAWFVCEGPSSRTDMAGLPRYHAPHLDLLKEMQCPIPNELFDELRLGETNLGPPQQIVDRVSETEVLPGLSIRTQTSLGTRRDGFELLRDTITKHRRTWADRYIDKYLHARSEIEIQGVVERFYRMIADRGKAPTIKQFAKFGLKATNHWFGGDVSGLYAAMKEKTPAMVARKTIMPTDRVGFAWSVFCALGGKPFERKSLVQDREEATAQAEAQQRNHQLKRLAEESLRYIQLEEALGQAPTLDEFGRSSFARMAERVSDDVEKAWSTYGQAIVRSLSQPTPQPEAYRSPGVVVPQVGQRQSPAQKSFGPSQSAESVTRRRSWLDRLLGRE